MILRKLQGDINSLNEKLSMKKSNSHAFNKFDRSKTHSSQIGRPKNSFGYKTGISNTTTLAGTQEISKDEIFSTKKEKNSKSKIQSFGNDSESDGLRKVKTLQQPIDKWDLGFFSTDKKSKPKGSFADRFKRAIKKEGNISKIKKPIEKYKKKKQETLAKKMESTMARGKKIGNENEVVGQKNIAKNMELELEAEDAEFERLYECQQCGRSFKRDALEKHQKVCKKVFQLKRKEFETDQKRLVSKDQRILAAKGKRKMQLDKNLKKKKGKNWKKQSEGLRSLIRKKGKKNKGKKEIEVEIVV